MQQYDVKLLSVLMRTWLKCIPFMMMALCLFQCKKNNDGGTGEVINDGPNSITNVEEKQQSLIIVYMGTWSGACPAVAARLDSVSKEHIEQLNLYVGPSALAPYYKDVDGVCKRSVFPLDAMAGLEQYPVPAISMNCAKAEIGSKASFETAAATFAQNKPVANTACKVTSGAASGKLVIETKTRFFQPDNSGSEYVLSVFIVEDDIDEVQSGSWVGYRNNRVIRAAVGGTLKSPVLFHSVATGSVGQGTDINRNFTFTYEDSGNAGAMNHWKWNPSRTSVVAVLCKRDKAMHYTFVNASRAAVMP